MRLSISVVGLVGVLAMPVPAVGADPPVLSVAYVGAHIGELHGKTVRLRGEVNNCESLTCSICDEGGRDAVCLPLDLWSDAAGRGLTEELYRFATVTIDARIDATCTLGYDPDRGRAPSKDEVVVCTDRSSAVEEARVVRVDRRRSATKGRFDAYEGYSLRRASEGEERPIIQAWAAQQRRLYPSDQANMAMAVFVEAAEGRQAGDAGYRLCVCRIDGCDGAWPSKSGEFVRSPGNPYFCMRVDRYAADWVFSY